MSNGVQHDNSQAPADPSKVKHLFVFVHGFGSSGASHGGNVKERIDALSVKQGGWMYIAKCNCSSWKIGTFYKTSMGVEYGGRLLAQELQSLCRTLPRVDSVSFIGSSLGGLYSRVAAGVLFPPQEEDTKNSDSPQEEDTKNSDNPKKTSNTALPANVKPGFFITLATPHLGVRCLYREWNSWLLGYIPTGSELSYSDNNTDPLLLRLAQTPYLSSLSRFRKRIAYCPVWNDGIVAYASTRITHDNSKCRKEGEEDKDKPPLKFGQTPLILNSTKTDGSTNERKGDTKAYFAGDAKEAIMWKVINGLQSLQWEFVDVNLCHKRLATLFPRSDAEWEKGICNTVIQDLMKRLES